MRRRPRRCRPPTAPDSRPRPAWRASAWRRSRTRPTRWPPNDAPCSVTSMRLESSASDNASQKQAAAAGGTLAQARLEDTGAQLAALEAAAEARRPAVRARLRRLYQLGPLDAPRHWLDFDDLVETGRAWRLLAMLAARDTTDPLRGRPTTDAARGCPDRAPTADRGSRATDGETRSARARRRPPPSPRARPCSPASPASATWPSVSRPSCSRPRSCTHGPAPWLEHARQRGRDHHARGIWRGRRCDRAPAPPGALQGRPRVAGPRPGRWPGSAAHGSRASARSLPRNGIEIGATASSPVAPSTRAAWSSPTSSPASAAWSSSSTARSAFSLYGHLERDRGHARRRGLARNHARHRRPHARRGRRRSISNCASTAGRSIP